MRSSKSDKNRPIGRERVLVVGAVGALLAAVVLSSPGVVWLITAVVAAAIAVLAMWAIGRTDGDGPDQHRSDTTTSGTAAPVDSPTDSSASDHGSHAVSDFVVSLARRNGGLVDQQLALLDQLEASVEDPALLANYFKLDHLATRMRRNADSLLVLAGIDRPGLRSPQAIDEVVRAGISEVEDYRRIDVLALEDVQVTGLAATTLGHLVAELLDNATTFSPPQARVRVAGNAVPSGYEILVADSGIGISDSRTEALNRKLALPPQSGAVGDASIGLTVVAMLAARIGATVRLASGEHGGTVATVHIPSSALHDGEHAVAAFSAAPIAAPVIRAPEPQLMTSLVAEASQRPLATPTVETIPYREAIPHGEQTSYAETGPIVDVVPFLDGPPYAAATPVVDVVPDDHRGTSVEASPSTVVAASPSSEPSPGQSSTIAREAADAIARLTLTVSGLPVRPVSTTVGGPPDAAPRTADGATMFWPPPAATSETGTATSPNAFGSLQIAEPTESRPVVEAHADRIGSAMSSFARHRGSEDGHVPADRDGYERTSY